MNALFSNQRLAGIGYVLAAVLIWVGWTVSSSYSVRGGLTPYDLTALRFGTAGLILLPVVLKKGIRIGPWGVWSSLWLACTMGATYSFITITGMQYAPTSHASGIIINTMLVLTTAGAILLLREGTTRWRLFGILVCVTGVGCLLYAKGNEGVPESSLLLGHGLFLLGGTIWALHSLSLKAWKVDPLHVTAVVCVVSAITFLPFYFLFLPKTIGMHNLGEAAMHAAYQGILNSFIAGVCYNRAIRALGVATTNAFVPLVPVLSTLVAIPVMKEIPTALEWGGLALAAIGVFLATGLMERLILHRRA